VAVGLDAGATAAAGPTGSVDPLSEQFRPRWVVTWFLRLDLPALALKSAAKLHPRLGEPGTEHTVTIEEPPADAQPGEQFRLI
jgi:hypothetical protein